MIKKGLNDSYIKPPSVIKLTNYRMSLFSKIIMHPLGVIAVL